MVGGPRPSHQFSYTIRRVWRCERSQCFVGPLDFLRCRLRLHGHRCGACWHPSPQDGRPSPSQLVQKCSERYANHL